MRKIGVFLCITLLISSISFWNHPVTISAITEHQYQDALDAIERQREENDRLRELLDQLPTSTPKPTSPKLKLQDPSIVSINGGRTHMIDIIVKNIGTGYANNIVTQASAGAGAPFTIAFKNNSNAASSVYSGGTHKMQMEVVVDKNAPSGSYPITLTYSYVNDDNSQATDTDTFYVRVDNDAAVLNVIMYDFKNSRENVNAGDAFTLSASLENTSVQAASDVQVIIDGLNSTEVYLTNSVGNAFFKTLNSNTAVEVSFDLSASPRIKNGSYPLTFTVKYRDTSGKSYENVYHYYVNVGGAAASESKAVLEVGSLTAPSGNIGVGQEFSIQVPITNNGADNAKNIKIAATSEDGVIVPRSSNIQLINNLGAGESKTLAFAFSPTSKSMNQNYTIGFTVSYETGGTNEDGSNEVLTFAQYTGVNVTNPNAEDEEEKAKASAPKIIVSRYESDPKITKAGQEFTLSITFQNTHSQRSIENVKAYLTAVDVTEEKGNVFTPVDASNTFYIDKIEPKGEVERVVRMYTVPNASPRNYIITVNFEYEDSDHNEYKSTEQVGINVKQVTKMDMGDINVESQGFSGQPTSVYFEFYNTGKVTLSNLMIRLEGNFDATNTSIYYSNFSPGYTESYDAVFIPTETGKQTGKIIISYEDDSGEKIEEIKEFEIDVMEMAPMGNMDGMPMGDMMMRPAEPVSLPGRIFAFFKNPWVIGGIVTGVVAIAAVIFFVARRIKKKRSFDLDE